MGSTDKLVELSRSDLARLPAPTTATITENKDLSSYNWIEAETPTIAVPGCPPTWIKPDKPQKVDKDQGHFYIAQNAARHPDSPLEPLFRSLYQTSQSFDIRSVDVVSDRNNFRKLLKFVDPSIDEHAAESFTIRVEVVGDTALFNRDETAVQEMVGPQDFRGFGHSYEQLYTRDEITNSTGHHRIISYLFGELRVVIRYETDAHIKGPQHTSPSLIAEDDITQKMSALSVSEPQPTPVRFQPAGSKMTIVQEGHTVPRSSTLEIKTKSMKFPLEVEHVAPQLWVSQTPKLVQAHHVGGFFRLPLVEDVSGKVREWEQRHNAELRMLAAVIRKIRDVAKEYSSCKAIVKFDAGRDRLIIQPSNESKMLPDDLYSKWAATAGQEPEAQDAPGGGATARSAKARPEHKLKVAAPSRADV